MQLVRALASYYRHSHLNLDLRPGLQQVPLGRQLVAVRRPESTSAFGQAACRRLTAPPAASSPGDDGIHAHDSGNSSAEGPPLPPVAQMRRWFATRFAAHWRGNGMMTSLEVGTLLELCSPLDGTKWAVGSVVALVLSLWSTRWQKLLLIGSEVENAVKVVETAAEVVEEVATAAEKVSAEMAEKLPADGRLKQVALAVEKASMEVVAGAETVEGIIHKVDELEQEVKTLLKPVIDQTKDPKASLI